MNTKTQKCESKAQKHPFEPIFDKDSRVLILGSFPSEKSIEKGFYYSSGSNRLWGILDGLFNEPKIDLAKRSKDEKIAFLKAHKIALYDIWGVCYKASVGSKDNDIIAEKSQRVDLSEILRMAKIQRIFTAIGGSQMSKAPRGDKFKKWGVEKWLWDEYREFFPHCKTQNELVVPLYSTSNSSPKKFKELVKDYKQILKFVK